MRDYAERRYLSAIEVARYLDLSVKEVHELIAAERLPASVSGSGQYRVELTAAQRLREEQPEDDVSHQRHCREIAVGATTQRLYTGDARRMPELEDGVIHLAITSPPYFNAKLYGAAAIAGDLGDIHDLDEWFEQTGAVWREVMRVLQPGRKFFINIMNLPVRGEGTYRTLNLTGRTIDLCEEIGFVFKRDIIWHKTNGVRAHFGTYPLPGGILINHMHEYILEFQKPSPANYRKYGHVSREQRERSRLDRDFWLSLKNSDVWLIKPAASGDGRKHVAPFPLELPYRLVKAFSFEGETVLDPFAGSGTALAAAAQLGRHGVGFEVREDYAELTARRLSELEITG